MPEEFGIGVDIERISRFSRIKDKNDRFLKTFLTVREIDYCFSGGSPHKHIAARFAAKEAVIKALGSLSVRDVSFKNLEILNDDFGSPSVSIAHGGKLNIRVEISLSHCDSYAVAFAIAVGV